MSQPHGAHRHSLSKQAGLVKRLSHTQSFKGHSSTVNALDWSPDGEILLSGSDDCRIKLWNAESGKALHTFDSGHTSSIYVSKFLPNCSNAQIITSAADRQIRLVNLERSAIKPYTFHHGKVKALVALDPCLFMSGSDDGTVRHYDTRDPESSNSLPGMRSGDVLADQKYERTPRGPAKVGINAVAVDSMRPHLFVTGSGDPMVRLYDRRMSGRRGHSASPSGRNWPQWVSCFIPTSLKTDAILPRPGTERAPFISSVKFSTGGDQVFASYSGDNIYSFLCTDHARESEAYCEAQGLSRPSSAFGTRSASRHAVLNTSADVLSNGRAQEQATTRSLPLDGQHRATTTRPSSGGLSTAAAAAVARIRAHRAAARVHQAARDDATAEAATQTTGYDDPSGHQLPTPQGISSQTELLPQPANISDLAPARAATAHPQHNPGVRCNAPDDGSGGAFPTADEVSMGGPAADRLAAAPRPPLPFHPIRRSARLHKSAGHSAGEATQQTVAHEPGAAASSAQDVNSTEAAETAGPCTRHSCKRKLAQMSGAAPGAAEKQAPSTQRRHTHMAASTQAGPASTAAATQSAAVQVQHPHPDEQHRARMRAAHQAYLRDTAHMHEGVHRANQLLGPAPRDGQLLDLVAGPVGDSDPVDQPESSHMAAAQRGTGLWWQMYLEGSDMNLPRRFIYLAVSEIQGPASGVAQQREADVLPGGSSSLDAQQHGEACVASSRRRLEQPTASTGTSRPVPLLLAGAPMQMLQTRDNMAPGPPDFLRLQYSTNPPSSAETSRENTPDQVAEVAQTVTQPSQAQTSAEQAVSDFPRPNRLTRRARASRLAPLPASSAAPLVQAASANLQPPSPPDTASKQAASANLPPSNPHDSVSRQAASANLPSSNPPDIASRQAACVNLLPLDPSDIVSRQSSDAAGQSQAFSDPLNGPAASTSAEARPDSCNAVCHGDLEPPAEQPREGTPVSSNRQPYRARARGSASVEASNAPKAPTWHASSSSLPATAGVSSGGCSPRGSRTIGRQATTSDIRQPQPEADPGAAGPADDEVLSPNQQEEWEWAPVGATAEAIAEADEIAARNARALQQPRRDGELVPIFAPPRFAWHRLPVNRNWAGRNLPEHRTSAQQGLQRTHASQQRQTAANSSEPSAAAVTARQAEQDNQHPAANHAAGRLALQHLTRASDSAADAAPAESEQAAANSPARALSSCPEADANGPSRDDGNSPEADTNGHCRAVASSPEPSSMPALSHSMGAPGTDQSRDGQLRQFHDEEAQLAGVVDSFLGAIVQEDSDDEADGEVVEERGMFHRCYKGHCNLSQSREVCLMGSRDEFVVTGSDDGRIFIWDQHTTRLVNLLTSDDHNIQCVTPHPSMPVLASAGSESVVKLWSPQAESACCLQRAEAIMSHNAQELAEGDRRSNPAGPQPLWLNMLGTAVSAELRAPGEAAPARNTNPVRCTIM